MGRFKKAYHPNYKTLYVRSKEVFYRVCADSIYDTAFGFLERHFTPKILTLFLLLATVQLILSVDGGWARESV